MLKSYTDAIQAGAAAIAAAKAINKGLQGNTTNDNSAIPKANQTDQNKRPRLAAGGPVGSKFQKSDGTINLRKKRMTKLQMLLLKDAMTTDYCIGRFQRLTPSLYDHASITQAAYRLNKQYNSADNIRVELPFYAFNLTMSPVTIGYEVSRLGYSMPFYRLRKFTTASGALDAATDNYYWDIQKGQMNDGTTLQQTYDVEKCESFRDEKFYVHEWSDVGISLCNNGAKSHKVHIALAKFRNPAAEPNRFWRDTITGADMTVDALYPKEMYNAADLAWDKFWSTKTLHPLRTIEPMRDSKLFDLLTYDCICLEPMGNTRTGMPIHTWKRFIRNGQLINTRTFTTAETAHKPDINTQTTACNYNQDIPSIDDTPVMTPVGRKGCDTYLFIWSDAFGDISPYGDETARAIPSFDLKVRTKVSYAHQ